MKVKFLTRVAILMALNTVLTTVISIPIIGSNGYLNLGDAVIFLSALLLGKKAGFLVGGIGSAIADIILGYTHYAPITLIVKGLEGYIVGKLFEREKKNAVIITSIGAVIMTFGYYIAESFLYGWRPSLIAIPGNLLQGMVGAVSSVLLYKSLKNKI